MNKFVKGMKEYVANMVICWRVQYKILKFGVSNGTKLQRAGCAVAGVLISPIAVVYNLVVPAVAVFKKLPFAVAESAIDTVLADKKRQADFLGAV
jgi:hypothetical protein